MSTRPALLAAVLIAAACASGRPAAPRDPDDVAAPPDVLAEEAAGRRRALAERLGPGVVWMDGAGEEGVQRFFQANDFLYLSGVEVPDVGFAIRIGDDHRVADEVLFLPPHDPDFEVWNGARPFPGPEAEAATGFARTLPLDERQAWLDEAAPEVLYLLDDDARADLPVAPPPATAVDTVALRGALGDLRWVKSDYEIACLRAAIDITGAGQLAAAGACAPGRHEFELQAALEGAFLRLGGERTGFASICGSGPNSVTLHYNANRRRMDGDDLVVVDVGTKYRGYCADVTRTYPVSGRFTPRQREIYEIVLRAQKAAEEAARPGTTLADLDEVARGVIAEAGYGEAFKHGIGHWIGLHVHDLGDLRREGEERGPRRPLVPGTLFTIEPGIYLADEELGVRIEDDYLMTEDGAVRLSTIAPREPDAVEALLAR